MAAVLQANKLITEWLADSPSAEIIPIEKSVDGRVTIEEISDALREYTNLFKAGYASPAQTLTLHRAYPDNPLYAETVKEQELFEKDPSVVGGPASVEIIDREGHLITTNALSKAFNSYMKNPMTRNVMVMHSDIQVGWALPAYISKSGQIYKSGIGDNTLFFITELRDDTKISKRVVEEIKKSRMKSYSIAGSAIRTENVSGNMFKGEPPYMRVDELELAEVTICEKGVNQGAGFDLIKSNRPTKSCADESCFISKDEGHAHNQETKTMSFDEYKDLLTSRDGKSFAKMFSEYTYVYKQGRMTEKEPPIPVRYGRSSHGPSPDESPLERHYREQNKRAIDEREAKKQKRNSPAAAGGGGGNNPPTKPPKDKFPKKRPESDDSNGKYTKPDYSKWADKPPTTPGEWGAETKKSLLSLLLKADPPEGMEEKMQERIESGHIDKDHWEEYKASRKDEDSFGSYKPKPGPEVAARRAATRKVFDARRAERGEAPRPTKSAQTAPKSTTTPGTKEEKLAAWGRFRDRIKNEDKDKPEDERRSHEEVASSFNKWFSATGGKAANVPKPSRSWKAPPIDVPAAWEKFKVGQKAQGKTEAQTKAAFQVFLNQKKKQNKSGIAPKKQAHISDNSIPGQHMRGNLTEEYRTGKISREAYEARKKAGKLDPENISHHRHMHYRGDKMTSDGKGVKFMNDDFHAEAMKNRNTRLSRRSDFTPDEQKAIKTGILRSLLGLEKARSKKQIASDAQEAIAGNQKHYAETVRAIRDNPSTDKQLDLDTHAEERQKFLDDKRKFWKKPEW